MVTLVSTELPTAINFKNLSGKDYGRWTVVSYAGQTARTSKYYNCVCACGHEQVVAASNLVSGKSEGCAACRKKRNSEAAAKKSKHPNFHIWHGMITRCHTNPSERYGLRGIVVCDRWRGPDGFAHFNEDMGIRPSAQHSIDRYPNNDGNYEPGNCRWATDAEQKRNTSVNVYLTIDGVSHLIKDWSAISGVKVSTIKMRHYAGWTDRDCVFAPKRPGRRKGIFKINLKKDLPQEVPAPRITP